METGTTPRLVLVVTLALVFLFTFTSLLAKAYRSERQARASRYFQAGGALAREGRYEQAVEKYEAALTLSAGDSPDRLALAQALVSLGRLNEANAHLRELSETDPADATVNLLLAQVAARQGRVPDAMVYYRRAVYGLWPADPEKNRLQTRFEFIHFLAGQGQRKQALAQLLELAAEAPNAPAIRKRMGSLFMANGSPRNAADLFKEVLAENPGDAEAYRGLGEANFAEGDYLAALAAFRNAVRRNPQDTEAAKRLEECSQIVEMDPTLVRLSSRERYLRSRELLRRVLEALEQCETAPGLAREARQVLAATSRRRREGDIPKALALSVELWNARRKGCGPSPGGPLALVMARITK